MNLSTFLKSALIATSLLAVPAVHAQDKKVVIKMHNKMFQGQNTLKLKVLAQQQHPGLKVDRFDLERVRLVAKSRQGKGTAALRVGKRMSAAKTIAGIPSEFAQSDGYTYDRLNFVNPKNNSNGVWQMDLKGRIKVKRVVLFLDRKSKPTQPGGPIKKSCRVTLETIFGNDLTHVTKSASGQTAKRARNKACNKALSQCQKMIGDAPFLMCTINR